MSDTSKTFSINPTSGGKLEKDTYTISVADTDKNYGRNNLVQNLSVKTYGDSARTDLKKTTSFSIIHKAANLRIFEIRVKGSEPIAGDFNFTKNIPTSKSSQQLPSSSSVVDGKYFVYGMTNAQTIVCSNNTGSSASIVASSFKRSTSTTSPSGWAAGTISGMILNPNDASYGTTDVYYFYFQVNTGGNATSLNVVAESSNVSSKAYTITTNATGQISVTPASISLPAVHSDVVNNISFENTTSSTSAAITKSGTFFDVLDSQNNSLVGQTITSGDTKSGNVIYSSNYTTGTGGYLQDVHSSTKTGSISCGSASCAITQADGTITSATRSINGGNTVTLYKDKGDVSNEETVSYVSKAYMNDDGIGVPVKFVLDGTAPGNLIVNVVDANNVTVQAASNTTFTRGTPYEVKFKNVKANGGNFTDTVIGTNQTTLYVYVEPLTTLKPIFTVSECRYSQGNDITFTIICPNKDQVGDSEFNIGLSEYVGALQSGYCTFTIEKGATNVILSGTFSPGSWTGEGSGSMEVTKSMQGSSINIPTGTRYTITPDSTTRSNYELTAATNIEIN